MVSLFLRHIQAWRNPGEMLNSVQASGIRSKGEKKARFGEVCRILTWNGKEFCPNKRSTRDFQEGTLIKPAKENTQLRQLSEARSEIDRRGWRMRNADIALYETGIQLQPQRMELYQGQSIE